MIGGGVKKLDQSYKPMKSVLPKDALWIKDKVTEIEPRNNKVVTEKGDIVEYDFLVVATGIELDFNKVTFQFQIFIYLFFLMTKDFSDFCQVFICLTIHY